MTQSIREISKKIAKMDFKDRLEILNKSRKSMGDEELLRSITPDIVSRVIPGVSTLIDFDHWEFMDE